jgi:hypothetical protein
LGLSHSANGSSGSRAIRGSCLDGSFLFARQTGYNIRDARRTPLFAGGIPALRNDLIFSWFCRFSPIKNNIKAEQYAAYCNENIGNIKNSEINKIKGKHIDHIALYDAVYPVANSAGKDQHKRPAAKFSADHLFSEQDYYCYDEYRGDSNEKPTGILQDGY